MAGPPTRAAASGIGHGNQGTTANARICNGDRGCVWRPGLSHLLTGRLCPTQLAPSIAAAEWGNGEMAFYMQRQGCVSKGSYG